MWLLVEYPGSREQVLFRLMSCALNMEDVKRGYRRLGGRVIAVYRLKPAA